MKQRTGRIYQYVVSIIVVLVMMMAHNSTFSFDVPLMLTGLALLAALLISSKRLRDAEHLISPLDYGWLPFILLTGWGCDFEDEAYLAGAGIDVVLEKPVELTSLLEILHNLITKR